jgi:hypothetical protein
MYNGESRDSFFVGLRVILVAVDMDNALVTTLIDYKSRESAATRAISVQSLGKS